MVDKKEPASTVAVAESLDSIGHCLVVARLRCWLAVKNNIVFFLNFSFIYLFPKLGSDWKGNLTCPEGSQCAARIRECFQAGGRTHGRRSGFQTRWKISPVWKLKNIASLKIQSRLTVFGTVGTHAIIWGIVVEGLRNFRPFLGAKKASEIWLIWVFYLKSGWFGWQARATVSPAQTTRLRKLAGLHLNSTSTYFLQHLNVYRFLIKIIWIAGLHLKRTSTYLSARRIERRNANVSTCLERPSSCSRIC